MTQPFIACLCCTYKRPKCLANAVACFLAQKYENKTLVILDDARQYYNWFSGKNRVHLFSMENRYESLSQKRNVIHDVTRQSFDPKIYAVWDDDDVYLPNYLSNVADGYERGGEFFLHKKVLTTYGCGETGETIVEEAEHVPGPWNLRFHASWAFTRELFERVGGYPPDMVEGEYEHSSTELGRRLRDRGKVEYIDGDGPSYVCRVFNHAEYHVTQTNGKSYQQHWGDLAKIEAPFVGELVPRMDDWTERIYKLTGDKK